MVWFILTRNSGANCKGSVCYQVPETKFFSDYAYSVDLDAEFGICSLVDVVLCLLKQTSQARDCRSLMYCKLFTKGHC